MAFARLLFLGAYLMRMVSLLIAAAAPPALPLLRQRWSSDLYTNAAIYSGAFARGLNQTVQQASTTNG
jgi:hypothetical protein